MAAPTYQVHTSLIENLFHTESAAFVVPRFQRPYAWGPAEVEALLDDLYDEEGEWLGTNGDHYFLGSIVLAQVSSDLHILDGQQRLTTIGLVLAAIDHRLKQLKYDSSVSLRTFLVAGRFGEEPRPKIRLQEADMPLYERLIEDPDVCEATSVRKTSLGRAMRRVLGGVDRIANRHRRADRNLTRVLEAMAQRLLYSVEIVRIQAPDEGMAYRLFETLNDRGLPLNAADLIKNKLFAQAGNNLGHVQEAWDELRETIPKSEILNFLRYFWIAKEARVRKDKLYDAMKARLRGAGATRTLQLARELLEAGQVYQYIADPERRDCPWDRGTRDTLGRLISLRARSCRPLLLLCALHHPKDFNWLVGICEAASVRQTLVGARNPNQLEKAYASACGELRGTAGELREVVLSALSLLVPSDDEFASDFASAEVPNVTAAWRTVLLRLNDELSSGEMRVEGPDKVHVEHVFPQTPSRAALEESGFEDDDDARDAAHRIGNLTLLAGKKNIAISNKPFSQKQAILDGSEIALNRYFEKLTRWGASEIGERSVELAKLAGVAWSWPAERHRPRRSSRPPPRPGRARNGNTDPQLPIAYDRGAGGSVGMPALGATVSHLGSRYVPRILWALEHARRHELGAISAATIATIVTDHAGLKVANTNVARAFRSLRGKDPAKLWVEGPDLHYRLSDAGKQAFGEVFGERQKHPRATKKPLVKSKASRKSKQSRPKKAKGKG